MGTGIKRVQAVLVVLVLAILGFLGSLPAAATETDTTPGSGQPVTPGEESTSPEPIDPVPPVVIPPILPAPDPSPLEPEPEPAPVQPPEASAPAPVVPAIPDPVVPPAAPSVTPVVPVAPMPAAPQDAGIQGYAMEPQIPQEGATVAPVEPTPSPTPTPTLTKNAPPPVVSAEIAGPLKVALAPVAESNPIVQGLTVLVLVLLGLVYFRALRSKGIRGPRLNGK